VSNEIFNEEARTNQLKYLADTKLFVSLLETYGNIQTQYRFNHKKTYSDHSVHHKVI